ncbi:hypothetical protein CRE_05729 [Caenorhabditis remanei]|uniref:Uncharacterized protein n=1 Tax=Caenorhabditis remanei TaxID=31234 RepID=E3LZR8_CAERE|nr:hypothetical protein CRE_05729 [Caenorhabditis remanei]
MSHMFSLCFLLTLFSSTYCANLIMMQAIWRHGDRAPGDLPYPKDRYNETYWPRGWDQLTNKGIWQSVELGIWLRQRYGSTVLPIFNKDKVFILSSDSERAIETAQGVSAGLFPPTDDRVWESSYLRYWQPTPIQTAYGTIDALLRPTKVKCPNYDLANENEESPIAAQVNSEYGQMFKWLQNTTGMESIDFWNINDLYDIQREIDHNMPQPSWLNQVFNGTTIMDHIRELKRITRNQEFNSPTKAKFRGGMLVNQFLQNMEDLKANKTTKNALMYSSHDGTLSALLYALNVSNDQLVPYTATVLFELYDDDTVQVFYKNTTNTAYPMTIPGCLQICPYSQFLELLEHVRVRSLDALYSVK